MLDEVEFKKASELYGRAFKPQEGVPLSDRFYRF